ncbi:MBL fold metallo-hydrolase [Serinibacter salmoneus]|uniref:Glyoxylase-like metal-dependent hydrolase (Beta-lactamase superfamily II) n=1 Tax=Serinibacter salmoneus TaxID=556530 RepID=A0A2A9D3M2_9MICO|nr:MBL fold metallo-hydrolase [Serinibacter salmoneus]PFG20981.1 glyoxylase-like metal-dependent hydrolase (beta-lactamase superfamily II) [Serinibacter salmoneus]
MTLRLDRHVSTAPAGSRRPGHETNVLVVGDAQECLVVDPGHPDEALLPLIDGRDVVAILLTHGHWDHVGGAPWLAGETGAPVLLHPADLPLWRETHAQAVPDGEASDGLRLAVGSGVLQVRHTPGHTPGSSILVATDLGLALTGDTLFRGGPGATRWEYSSFPTILESIAATILTLPPTTVLVPGHGPDTSVAAEAGALEEWRARGW